MSWEPLLALARETLEVQEMPRWLGEVQVELRAIPRDSRGEAIALLARQLAEKNEALQLTRLCAGSADPGIRQLALAVVAWLPVPLEPSLVNHLRPLLSDKSIPGETRLDAATALLQTTGPEGMEAHATLQALLARTGKARGVERLRKLMLRLGKTPLLEQMCRSLEGQVRMRCPRCRVQLRRPEMTDHLWSAHGLVLEGRRVREPWSVIHEWLDELRRGDSPGLLDRCRDLAKQCEGEQGLHRLERLLLVNGLRERHELQSLREEAARRHSGLCPRCLALVELVRPAAVPPLNQSHGRLSRNGFSVEISERGFAPHLEIVTPGSTVYRGREPERSLTRRGALVFLVGPLVLFALVAGMLCVHLGRAPLLPVAVPLFAALVTAFGIRLYWLNLDDPLDRAVDHAWRLLVPRLDLKQGSAEVGEFLGGLILLSGQHGTPTARAEELARRLAFAEQAVPLGRTSLAQLAVLHRLAAADAATQDADLVLLLAGQVRRALLGELPLRYAEEILGQQGWRLSQADQARLRVLVADAAFEAGLEVREMEELGQTAPSLGAVLKTDRLRELAQLRLLWSLRPRRPWRRWGDARTVFELAVDPYQATEHFSRHPDLLLVDREPPCLILTSRGLAFRDAMIAEQPYRISVREADAQHDRTYELVVGDHRFGFWNDPTPVRVRVEGWLRFWFEEFLPRLPEVRDWQPPEPPRTLFAQEVAVCPECQTVFWARVGEVGTLRDGKPDETPQPETAPL